MLLNQTVEQLRRLRLSGMAAAFAQQLEQPELQALSFEERFSLLLDREITRREDRRLSRLLQLARLRQQACVEDIDYKHRRGLERSLMASLISGDWIRARHNLHLTGPTGTGKSWLACALGHQACRQGLSVRYERVPHPRRLWSQTFNSGRAPRPPGACRRSAWPPFHPRYQPTAHCSLACLPG